MPLSIRPNLPTKTTCGTSRRLLCGGPSRCRVNTHSLTLTAPDLLEVKTSQRDARESHIYWLVCRCELVSNWRDTELRSLRRDIRAHQGQESGVGRQRRLGRLADR